MIDGLEFGADDYIVKHYSLRNVFAMVKTVLRRTSGDKPKVEYDNGKVTYERLNITPSSKHCIVDGEDVRLPKKKFEFLFKFVSNVGRVFT